MLLVFSYGCLGFCVVLGWLRKLELIIKDERLRWLEHVLRMDDSTIPHQAIVGNEGIQEEAGSVKEKLDVHCQTITQRYGHYLG